MLSYGPVLNFFLDRELYMRYKNNRRILTLIIIIYFKYYNLELCYFKLIDILLLFKRHVTI